MEIKKERKKEQLGESRIICPRVDTLCLATNKENKNKGDCDILCKKKKAFHMHFYLITEYKLYKDTLKRL